MCHVAVTLRCVVRVSCGSDTEVCCMCVVTVRCVVYVVTVRCVVCVS